MAEWMNQTGSIIKRQMPNINKYKDIDGLNCSVPKRIWSSVHADTPSQAVHCTRSSGSQISCSWRQLRIYTLCSGQTSLPPAKQPQLATIWILNQQSKRNPTSCLWSRIIVALSQLSTSRTISLAFACTITMGCRHTMLCDSPPIHHHIFYTSSPISSLAVQQPLAMMK